MRSDSDIKTDVENELEWDPDIDATDIAVTVKNGMITLEGEVEWNYQRELAANAVRRIKGVTSVSNLIEVKPRVEPSEVKRKVEEAFRRSAEIDASR